MATRELLLMFANWAVWIINTLAIFANLLGCSDVIRHLCRSVSRCLLAPVKSNTLEVDSFCWLRFFQVADFNGAVKCKERVYSYKDAKCDPIPTVFIEDDTEDPKTKSYEGCHRKHDMRNRPRSPLIHQTLLSESIRKIMSLFTLQNYFKSSTCCVLASGKVKICDKAVMAPIPPPKIMKKNGSQPLVVSWKNSAHLSLPSFLTSKKIAENSKQMNPNACVTLKRSEIDIQWNKLSKCN